jgi:membrane protein DedA with SNARE-associated domain
MIILATTSINSLLNSIGIGVFGSVGLFALALLLGVGLLMFVSNIPASFILVVMGLLVITMNAIWGGTVLNILAIIFAIIMGVIVGKFILHLFSSSGE